MRASRRILHTKAAIAIMSHNLKVIHRLGYTILAQKLVIELGAWYYGLISYLKSSKNVYL